MKDKNKQKKLNGLHWILLLFFILFHVGIAFAFIFNTQLLEIYAEIKRDVHVFLFLIVVFISLYIASQLLVIGKLIFLDMLKEYNKLCLVLYLFYTYGKTIFITIITMLITFVLIKDVDSTYPLLLLLVATVLSLLVFFIEKDIKNKIYKKVSKKEQTLLAPFANGWKKEGELKEIYNFERILGIIAAITTILILGDAIGALIEPLNGNNPEERWESYMNSKSFQFLLIFVSSNILFILEMINKGITVNGDICKEELGLDKTQAMVYFSLYGDEFSIDDVTEKLGVAPTKAYKKGDLFLNRATACYRKETSWDLGTGYQVSLDVNNQLQQIIDKLQNKSLIINEIKEAYTLECKFFIIVIREEGNTPSLYLDKDIIKFAANIEAEFDIDLYVSLYENDFND